MAADTQSQDSRRTRRGSIFERNRRTTLVLLFVLAFCGLDLLLARALSLAGLYEAPRKSEARYRIRHPVYHHTLSPLVRGYDANFGPVEHPIYTNSLGFKDGAPREIQLEPEGPRVVFIGDSFTEGIGVEYPDTFVGRIGAAFAPKGVEVLNAAVSSYTPVIHRRKIETLWDEGLRFDHLVVFLDISDAKNEARKYALGPDGSVVERKPRGVGHGLRDWLTENSIAFAHARLWIRQMQSDPVGEVGGFREGAVLNHDHSLWTVDDARYASWGREGLELGAVHMDALHAFSRERGFGLSIAVYPWPDQIWHRDLDSRQVAFWRSWAAAHEVAFIDYFPAFIDSDLDPADVIRTYFIDGDVHWNAAGHALIAERLLRELPAIASVSAGAPAAP